MADKLDEVKLHLFSLTDDEVEAIVDALYDAHEDELADQFAELAWPDDGVASHNDIATLSFNVDTSGIDDATAALNAAVDAAERLRVLLGNV